MPRDGAEPDQFRIEVLRAHVDLGEFQCGASPVDVCCGSQRVADLWISSVSTAAILPGQPDDQLAQRRRDRRATRLTP